MAVDRCKCCDNVDEIEYNERNYKKMSEIETIEVASAIETIGVASANNLMGTYDVIMERTYVGGYTCDGS